MKKSKLKRNLIIVIIGVVVLIGGGMIYLSQFDEPVIFLIEDIDFTTIPDGTYMGKADNSLIRVNVAVTVAANEVTAIEILEHRNWRGRSAEAITENVIDEQSLKVDAVSSATYSSHTILKAIENALTYQMEE